MLKEIKKEVTRLSLGSTAYGVSNLVRSKHMFSKMLWIFFLVTSSVASSYYVYSEIIEYLSYDVVTVVKSVYEQPSEFPTVTFCSSNKSYFYDYDIGQLAKDIQFGYDRSIGTEPNNHFEAFESQEYGKCFRFNSGINMTNHTIPIKKSTIGGRNDYFRLAIRQLKTRLVLWIHNRTLPPKIQISNNLDDPITISNGTVNYLAIDKTVESKLGEPHSQCLTEVQNFKQNKTIIQHILSQGELYTQINCLEVCFQLDYIQNNPCNCTETRLGNVWFDCWIKKENQSKESCTYKSKNNFYQKTLLDMCGEYCPLECESTSYSFTLSSAVYENSNTTLILVFYRSLKYTSIKEYAKMQPYDLVSNLGGSLGLFIGLSFVSLFEIAEICMEIVFILIKKSNRTAARNKYEIAEVYLEKRIKENEQKIERFSQIICSEINAIKMNQKEISMEKSTSQIKEIN